MAMIVLVNDSTRIRTRLSEKPAYKARTGCLPGRRPLYHQPGGLTPGDAGLGFNLSGDWFNNDDYVTLFMAFLNIPVCISNLL